MRVTFNDADFMMKMNNLIEYSIGYTEGIHKGKTVFLKNIGTGVIEILQEYIDTHARMDPQALHHVYEWYQTGSPEARLYDLSYTISNVGLSVKSKFRQSQSIKDGSTTPFYDKAKIMESGRSITISPKRSNVLSFEVDGETVFTSKDVTVEDPGGKDVQGSYERTFDTFFNNYFKQSFLRASGLASYLSTPTLYKKDLKAGVKAGKSQGIKTGYTWIANARIGVER